MPTNSAKNKILMFDFDGVLVDSFEISFISRNKIGPAISKKAYKELFHGNIYNRLKTAKLKVKKQRRDFFEFYGPLLEKLSMAGWFLPILKKLSKNYLLTIVSSTQAVLIKKFLKRHGANGYFDEVLGKEAHHSKVEKIKRILKKYKALPENCLFITDTLGDVREAKRCKVAAMGVTGGFHSRQTLLKGKPYKIISKKVSLIPAIEQFFKRYESRKSQN